MSERNNELTETEIRMVAAMAVADPRTVKRMLSGQPVRPLLAERIRKVLGTCGLPVPEALPR